MKNKSELSSTAIFLWTTLFTVSFTFLLGIPAFILDGFVGMKLWEWFVEPTFLSAPHIGIVEAAGLAILIGFFTRTHQVAAPDPDGTRKLLSSLGYLYVAPFLTLVVGYLASLFL